MPQQFRHMQYDERCQIHTQHLRGAWVSAMAAVFRRHESTVCDQLQYSDGPFGYRHRPAQQLV